jgi:hypothetical protein
MRNVSALTTVLLFALLFALVAPAVVTASPIDAMSYPAAALAIDQESRDPFPDLDRWPRLQAEPAVAFRPAAVTTLMAIPELSTLTLLTGGLVALFLTRRFSGWL